MLKLKFLNMNHIYDTYTFIYGADIMYFRFIYFKEGIIDLKFITHQVGFISFSGN